VVVKIDENEPNIFPAIDATDVNARANEQQIDLVFITRIEGKPIRVRVKLDRAKARVLAGQLSEALQGSNELPLVI
jgi:hypothetical protein